LARLEAGEQAIDTATRRWTRDRRSGLRGCAVAASACGVLIPVARRVLGIIATLNKQTNAAVLNPNIQQRFADLGVLAMPPNSPGEFTKFIAENIEKWTKVIKFAGIKPE